MFALLAVPLVGMLGLAIDVGMLMTARSEAQRAADAAALGGAGVFYELDPDKFPVQAEEAAIDSAVVYATRNHIRNAQVTADEVFVDVILDEDKVRVFVRREAVPTYFARILGFGQVPIGATAAAVLSEGGSAQCLMPFFGPDLWHEAGEGPTGNQIPDAGEGHWEWNDGTGDQYAPLGDAGEGTGYGSDYRDNVEGADGFSYVGDIGRRFVIRAAPPGQNGKGGKGGDPMGTMPAPGNFQLWLPDIRDEDGSCREGKPQDIEDLLRGDVCSCPTTLADPKPGVSLGLHMDALKDRIAGDPDAHWDVDNNELVSDLDENSPRVVPIALAEPRIVYERLQGKSEPLEFNNFAKVFLEDPVDENGVEIIYARFMGSLSGGKGPTTGALVKYLRLVE